MNPSDLRCQICGFSTSQPDPGDLGEAHGNSARFRQTLFHIWRCQKCRTLYTIDPAEANDLYLGYPRFKETLDSFAKATLGNLIKRLERVGLGKDDAVLYVNLGNNQVFLDIMKRKGYANVQGYNPYLEPFSKKPSEKFDYMVVNDSIEHVENIRETLDECVSWMKPDGTLYLGTPDASVVASMDHLDTYSAALHLPFHRIIITEATLRSFAEKMGMRIIASYRRSYLDTMIPFANRRFLEELSRSLGDILDYAYDPSRVIRALIRHPHLLFYGFFGYFFPSAYEPAIILRR